MKLCKGELSEKEPQISLMPIENKKSLRNNGLLSKDYYQTFWGEPKYLFID